MAGAVQLDAEIDAAKREKLKRKAVEENIMNSGAQILCHREGVKRKKKLWEYISLYFFVKHSFHLTKISAQE